MSGGVTGPVGLSPGQSVVLPDGPWLLDVTGPFDLLAVVLSSNGRVAGDGDLVFYNAPAAPGVRLRGAALTVDGRGLRPGTDRVVLLASPADGVTPLGWLPYPAITVTASGRPVAFFAARLRTQTVAQLAEVYRRGATWKLRALGDGYDDGLAGLARAYGVDVDEPAAEAEPAPEAAQRPPSPPEQRRHAPAPSRLVEQVLTLTNAERAGHALPPLTGEPRLQAAAQRHNDDMVARGYFAHESPEGGTVADRVQAEGYAYAVVAENIAAGQRTPAEVVQAWLDSPGHRRNLLNAEVRQLGVGVTQGGPYGTTWTQVFGRPR